MDRRTFLTRTSPALVLSTAGLLSWHRPAAAWWPRGHGIIAEAAVLALPEEVPAVFRSRARAVAHHSYDPDVLKNRDAPALRDAEDPEHYIDLELLQGKPLPGTRSAYLRLLGELKVEPRKAGLVPYAVTEWTERLAVAFAEHRRWPRNGYIHSKLALYAGFLAHYAGDLCQPLHTTIHFNGRARPDGSSPGTGIHARVDALPEKLALRPAALARGQEVTALAPLFPAVVAELMASHRLVDRVYELESHFPPEQGEWTPSREVTAFGTERSRAAARFLACLCLTAWRSSATLRLPEWLEREESTPENAATPQRRRMRGA